MDERKVTLEELKQAGLDRLDIQDIGSEAAGYTLSQIERIDKLVQSEANRQEALANQELEKEKLKIENKRIRVEKLKAGLGLTGKILGGTLMALTTVFIGKSSDTLYYDKNAMGFFKYIEGFFKARD